MVTRSLWRHHLLDVLVDARILVDQRVVVPVPRCYARVCPFLELTLKRLGSAELTWR